MGFIKIYVGGNVFAVRILFSLWKDASHQHRIRDWRRYEGCSRIITELHA